MKFRQHPCHCAPKARAATRVAGFRAWKELSRFVKRGEKGIQILAPMTGYRRKEGTEQEPEEKARPVLIGFRVVHVWERLSRDLRSRFYAPDVTRDAVQCTRDGSHVITQFYCPEQRLSPIPELCCHLRLARVSGNDQVRL